MPIHIAPAEGDFQTVLKGYNCPVPKRRSFQVIILGAGPAGAMTLRTLGENAHTLLVDRRDILHPESSPKLCGGLLTTQAQELLPQLPLHVRAQPAYSRLEFHDLDARRIWVYDVAYANCHRGELDRWLFAEALNAAGSNVTYEPRCRLVELRREDSGWLARLAHLPSGSEEEVVARFLVDASGWRQVSRRLLAIPLAPKLNAFQISGSIRAKSHDNFMAIFDSAETPFYCWWIPKDDGGELGAAFASHRRHGNPRDFLAPFLQYLSRRGIELHAPSAVRGCPLTYIGRRRDIWSGAGNLLVVGEAAGLVSPSSGDGISYALGSGKAAAETILQLLHGSHETEGGSESRSAGSARGASIHRTQTEYRRRLRPLLKELHLNIWKARWLASPRSRRWMSHVLPLVRSRHPRRLPFL